MEKEKGSPVVEGASVGREGRHFTVANVGQNGQIYLRYVGATGGKATRHSRYELHLACVKFEELGTSASDTGC